MKIVLISLVSFFVSLAMAQLLDATALKAKALKQNVLFNLNTASAVDLAKLPGVGPTHAKAIIDARPYNDVSDLKKVKGIKEEAVAKLKGLVTVK